MDRARNVQGSYGSRGYVAAQWGRWQNDRQGMGKSTEGQDAAVKQASAEKSAQESRDTRHSSPQGSIWNFLQYSARESVRNSWQDATQGSMWQSAQDSGQDTLRNPAREPAREPGQNPNQESRQASEQVFVQDFLERMGKKNTRKYVASSTDIISQLRAEATALKNAFDPKKRKNLYDATMDLTLIERIEKIPGLKAIQSRLMFQMRAVKASGAEASEIRSALVKLKKVVAKVKKKVKCLQKEAQLEKKRKRAIEAKLKAKARALKREKELRKKVRKARERNDIEESRMGLGANYGGPTGDNALNYLTETYMAADTAMAATEVGAAIDMAVGDGGAAVDASAGAVDISV